MLFHVAFTSNHPEHPTITIDDEGPSLVWQRARPLDPELTGDPPVNVGEKHKSELIGFIKGKVSIRRIDADSHYRSPNFFEFFAQVPEVTAFLSSTRSHGLGEEEHHHRSRLQQIKETNFFAELIGGFEISRCVTYLHRRILCTEEPTICHHARTSNPR